MTICGSMYLGNAGLVNVPGMNLPKMYFACVRLQNLSTGVFPYSLAEVTATLEISARLMNLAAMSMRERVLLISRMYSPLG